MADITGFKLEAVDPNTDSIDVYGNPKDGAVIAHIKYDEFGRPSVLVGVELIEVDSSGAVIFRNLFIGEALDGLLSDEGLRDSLFRAVWHMCGKNLIT